MAANGICLRRQTDAMIRPITRQATRAREIERNLSNWRNAPCCGVRVEAVALNEDAQYGALDRRADHACGV
jgi:hypothetical protein